ncbi:MAG: hypothetical protein AAF633_15405, partial [Chloroflexota bacterium]
AVTQAHLGQLLGAGRGDTLRDAFTYNAGLFTFQCINPNYSFIRAVREICCRKVKTADNDRIWCRRLQSKIE